MICPSHFGCPSARSGTVNASTDTGICTSIARGARVPVVDSAMDQCHANNIGRPKSIDLFVRITHLRQTPPRRQRDESTDNRARDTLAGRNHVSVSGRGRTSPRRRNLLRKRRRSSLLMARVCRSVSRRCDEVSAGTLKVLQRPIDVRVNSDGRDSRIGKVMQTGKGASEKIPIVQFRRDSSRACSSSSCRCSRDLSCVGCPPMSMAASQRDGVVDRRLPVRVALATRAAIRVRSVGRFGMVDSGSGNYVCQCSPRAARLV